MSIKSPFHPGEQHIQERLGIKDVLEPVAAQFIRDHMPDQHREFFAMLRFLTLGALDEQGRPWASMVTGQAGFVTSPDDKTLCVQAVPVAGDPLKASLKDGVDVGVLGLQLETRRRNRLSGSISHMGEKGFEIKARQSFGNCPKYIQTRQLQRRSELKPTQTSKPAQRFDDQAMALMSRSDTFFIASCYQSSVDHWSNGADVSHRGGKPGFVKILNEREFLFPDFIGNHFFNTLGNLMLNPKSGYLFPDFEAGHLLMMTGSSKIIWDSPEKRAFKGAQRLVRFELDECVLIENALPFTFEFGEYSPVLERFGSWDAVT